MEAATITEQEIIKQILSGDKDKYELLIRKYNPRLYRVALSILGEDALIEDVMQDAYIKAYRQLHTFEGRSSFSTWLTRILINECMMKMRQTKRAAEVYQSGHDNIAEPHHVATPERKALNSELKQVLETAISALPEKYRMVFVMREIEGMSVAETVDVLGVGEANVKTRLSRAKEMLRTQLMTSYSMPQLFEFNLIRCDRIVKNVFAAI